MFYIYAFLGWCAEVVFAAANEGVFVNRGFLLGPVCPVYGISVVTVLLLLRPLAGSVILLFIGSGVVITVIEFIVGLLAQKVMKQRLWDYTEQPFNIKGYVCLKFSLLWAVGGVVAVRVIQPVTLRLIALIPQTAGIVLLCVFSAIFIADIILTFSEALRLPRQAKVLDDIEKGIVALSDGIGTGLYEGTVRSVEIKAELDERYADQRAEFDVMMAERRAESEVRRATQRADFSARKVEIMLKIENNRKMLSRRSFLQRRLFRAYPRLDRPGLGKRLEKIFDFEKNSREESGDGK